MLQLVISLLSSSALASGSFYRTEQPLPTRALTSAKECSKSQSPSLLQSGEKKSGATRLAYDIADLEETAFGPGGIPCKIHQTWKTQEVPADTEASVSSWKKLNPACEYKLWDDADVETFVKTKFTDSIWPIWDLLTPIQRADAFRYLVVLEEGGINADIDVDCLKPLSQWGVPANITMVLGYELAYHIGEKLRKDGNFARTEQMEQWFFAAKRGHPLLRRAAEILRMKMNWGVEDTIELTGPGTFTDAAHEFLEMNASKPHFVKEGEGLSFPVEAKLGPSGEEVWILPADKVAFNKFGGLTADNEADRVILHRFKGSWKS